MKIDNNSNNLSTIEDREKDSILEKLTSDNISVVVTKILNNNYKNKKIENFLNNKNNKDIDNKELSILFLDFLSKNNNLNIGEEILPILYEYFLKNGKLEGGEIEIRKILNPNEGDNLYLNILKHLNVLKNLEENGKIAEKLSNFIINNPQLKLGMNTIGILIQVYKDNNGILNSNNAFESLKNKIHIRNNEIKNYKKN